MTHPELLTNVLPKPKGLPSKNLVKIFGGMVLMLLVLGMVISYEQESKPAADDFARVAASTLTSVERSRVDQNHQLIEDAFKASGLPSDMPLPLKWDPGLVVPQASFNASVATQNPNESFGIMRNALNAVKGESTLGPSSSEGLRPASALSKSASDLDLKTQGPLMQGRSVALSLPQGLPSAVSASDFKNSQPAQHKNLELNNSVWMAQESEVMNSKMVVADFDDQKSNPGASALSKLERWGSALTGKSPLAMSAELSSQGQRAQNNAATLKEVDRGAFAGQNMEADRFTRANSRSSSSSGSGLAEGVNPLDTLLAGLGANTEKPSPSSARGQDLDFLKDARNNTPARASLRPHRLESVHSVLEGTIIPAVLTRDIVSDLPGTITAQVSQTVYDSITLKTPLICKGAKLIGRYSNDIRTGQSRLLFAFTRLILLNGQSFNLTGFDGSDGLGQAGVGGEVDNHFLKIYGASLAIGALSDQVTKSQVVPQGAFASSSATGQIMVQTTREILQKGRDTAPTITVARGTVINVEVRQDLVFHERGSVTCT